ncbi:hypothetical protein Tco_0554938, partial [Tanacetum coccineum]
MWRLSRGVVVVEIAVVVRWMCDSEDYNRGDGGEAAGGRKVAKKWPKSGRKNGRRQNFREGRE